MIMKTLIKPRVPEMPRRIIVIFTYFSAILEQPKTPAPHCKEMKDAAQFYLNRVLKDYKGK